MILHNRRKRNAFYAEQRSLYATRLLEAIETEKAGLPLDEDQTLVLNRERAKIMAEEEKKGRGWGRGVWELAFGGLRSEEVGVGQVVVPTEAEVLERIGVDEMEVLEVAEGKVGEGELGGKVERREEGESGLLKAVNEKRREGEREVERRGGEGGPLDRMAERAVEKGMEKGKGGWLGWGR